MQKTTLSRRTFMEVTFTGAAATAIVAPLVGSTDLAWGKQSTWDPIVLDLNKNEFAVIRQPGGAMKIPNPADKKKPIIIVRTSETTIAAYSSKCTHFGCEVDLPVNGEIVCPCHGARFDTSGKVKKGPAKKDLPSFSAVLIDNTVTIKDAS